MVTPWLRILVLVFLWGALIEDSVIFILAWAWPDLWFRLLHGMMAAPGGAGLEVALLRRGAGQWLGFALAQAIALWRWRREPEWLAVVAGARMTDMFTDISYMIAVPGLTGLGWALLLPPPVLNLAGIVALLAAYRQARRL